MSSGSPTATSHAAAPTTTTSTACARRAFDGLTVHHVGIVVALCAVWAASITMRAMPSEWNEGVFSDWLRRDFAETFAYLLVTAAVMGLPILAAGNFGPASGWPRVATLAATTALVAPLGGLLRLVYLLWGAGVDIPAEQYPEVLAALWFRYVQQAGLLAIVLEFNLRETRSIESMHQAEAERLALEREMAAARLQVLQAQIEPHFLFNTLANVRRLYQADRGVGRAMLDDLIRYLEVALPCMRDDRSTVGRELALTEAYLHVQAIRLGKRLVYTFDVPADLHRFELPPMMLLTLVENAIKHGLAPLPEGGAIRICAKREGSHLQLDVVDDGRGLNEASGSGIGLANVRARLVTMHGGAASLELTENASRGVTATLRLPAVESTVEALP